MKFIKYFENINKHFATGNAREHAYRGDLATLLMTIDSEVLVTNEASSDSKINKPDYTITRKNIPIGYIEAKDIIDNDITGEKLNKNQFNRYKQAYPNIFFTNYLDFTFYQNGELKASVSIGRLNNGKIEFIQENFEVFEGHFKDFVTTISQNIKSPTKLASMMAGKAKQIALAIESALNDDDKSKQFSPLKKQMHDFQEMLIHDIDNKAFADIYAQTIAYGMFAARYHDPTLPTFSRSEAAELIPQSNPFLRKWFQDIAGYNLDKRLVWFVEDLVSIFLASDVAQIMKNFGKSTKQEDPVVHFYETFLGEYNPALRKARGVWYTPQPVVNFIVHAVDDILKTEFNLPQGLSDTSKIIKQIKKFDPKTKKYIDNEVEIHKVQILDPATGTGTFLAEVVKHIYGSFKGIQGIWSRYVTNDLIPRLNGFELLMASYAMAHLKMDMLLTETGYKPTDDQRFKIFLTNSLEEAQRESGTMFSSALSEESYQANEIKQDTPVMCVIGNPPYSSVSSNNGKWISDLIEDYKYIDGVHFNERKHWLNDDYVKFIRYAQYLIEKNGDGVIAFINPHGFLDNPTFRGMRWNLLKTYDKIFTIDLHGNSKKKEVSPDGSPDINVFDIQQGVSINIFIKNGKKKENELGRIFHFDLFGKREFKYDFLGNNSLKTIDFKELLYNQPNYFFIPKNDDGRIEYEKGVSIVEIFPNNKTGIVSMGDSFVLDDSPTKLVDKIEDFLNNSYTETELKTKFSLGKNYAKWIIKNKETIRKINLKPVKIAYRPFHDKYTIFDNNLLWRWREETMKHFVLGNNIGIVVGRQSTDDYWCNVQVASNFIDNRFHFSYKGTASHFPLYLYNQNIQEKIIKTDKRVPNINVKIISDIAKILNLSFTNEKEETPNTFAPIDLLDYIYAVLHSPTYREKYKEFLKIDFPRVPYPKDQDIFWKLVKLGGEMRQIHLLESPIVEKYITQYPEDGNNTVTKPKYQDEKVYINETQYFSNVPELAWNFYIGGYQPAQKWLKDRKDHELSYEDILHYQKIIVALSETDRIMKEIDKVEIE